MLSKKEKHLRYLISKRKYNKKNRLLINKKSRIYYKTHKKQCLEYDKEWSRKNKDKRRLYCRRYYKKHRKKELERRRKYRKTVQGQLSEINTKNKRRFQIKNTNITIKYLIWLKRITKKCRICKKKMYNNGNKPNGKQLDHIIPLNIGGKHIKNNIRFICKTCNLKRPKDGRDIK
jgi:hypothetical protein